MKPFVLLLVDGHAYAYRAFHAIRELRGPDGKATNAVFGFLKMLRRMEAELQPTHRAVIWDGGLATARIEALPAYKAQRPPMPDDLERQLPEIAEYLVAAGVSSFQREGVEADDLIAALAAKAGAQGANTVIASSDKDFMQLVTPQVGLLNPNDKTQRVWTADDVRAKAGVDPEQIVDWLSLIGDTVDNIPGVPGVGPKTAASLLRQFGSVCAIFHRLPEVGSARLRQALELAEPAVRRNQELIRLKTELPCEFSPADLSIREGDARRLAQLYSRWGFRSLLREVEAGGPAQTELF